MSRSLPLLAALLAIFALAPCAVFAQQWNGSTSATGSINRTGSVGIGVSNPVHPLDVAGIIQADSLLLKGQVGVALSPALEALYLGTMSPSSTGNKNTFIGFGVAPVNTTGNENTAVGYWALRDNTEGRQNVAIGIEALRKNTGGNHNVAVGRRALYSNTTGILNTAVGTDALLSNTTGNFNTAIGNGALLLNSTGSNNTAVGRSALSHNTTGENNTAFGHMALQFTTTGGANVAFGGTALQKNTTGANNVAFGSATLRENLTGQSNVAIGSLALIQNASGSRNLAIGGSALFHSKDNENFGLGYQAGYALTSGEQNIFLGTKAGDNLTAGSGNILIGHHLGTPTPTTSYHLNIGGLLYGNLSTGHIGIGKDTPGYALDVSGIINADSILVKGQPLVAGPSTPDTSGTWTITNGNAHYTSGNVGIGILSPSVKLDVGDEGQTSIRVQSTNGSAGFIADGSGSNYSNLTLRRDGATKWIVANAGTSDKFVIQDGALDTKLAIRGDVGYVGIGTESPSKPLHIKNALDVALRVESTDSFSGIEFVDPVTGGGNVFAAAQNGRFLIQTQGTERLTVSSGGNVGIGTTSPGYALDVAGTINADSLLVNGQPFSGGGAWASSNDDLYYSAGNVGIGTPSPGAPLTVATSDPEGIRVLTTDGGGVAAKLRRDSAMGVLELFDTDGATSGVELSPRANTSSYILSNLGIGTTNPTAGYKLDVNGDAFISDATPRLGAENNLQLFSNSGYVHLASNKATSGEGIKMTVQDGVGSDLDVFGVTTLNNTANAYFINSNVGIGTTDPQSKLAVNGTITSKEVIVTDTPGQWPDFVFADDYELRSLQEVQSFIEQNGHLPEVPSAAEVEANGVAVGAMQATLLQKIEELTLYLLEQEQRLEKLTEENKTLHERLSRVERDKP